jgi:hypothetical protein
MKTDSPADRPFITQNALLAFALYLAGIPFVDDAKPVLNIYDQEILKKLGFSGMTIEEAADAALRAGKKGHVSYSFLFSEALPRLLKIFGEEEKSFNEETGTVTATVTDLIASIENGEVDRQEAIVRLASLILKSRGQFMNLWKARPDLAMIRIPNAGKAEIREGPKGSKIVSNPGYRMVSLNASDKTKGKLRL